MIKTLRQFLLPCIEKETEIVATLSTLDKTLHIIERTNLLVDFTEGVDHEVVFSGVAEVIMVGFGLVEEGEGDFGGGLRFGALRKGRGECR
ncbi:hypothetical protein Vadar_006294 [Vaccinium darrowii]|uniref:Uncharacterized protein n=1 Tax=Vaccinium darrowii TaxID=229202 RepID=A0ACB7Z9S1_9ERIC|nr:hypothetical protein Vadar_006294 [Vaccinium darrowii]